MIIIFFNYIMSDGISENPFKLNDGKTKKKQSIWSHEQELLLAEWAEKAACFRWLHSKAEIKYESSHYRFSIPIIVLSTLSGTANFGIDSVVPEESKTIAQMVIGSVNIFAGILGTLQNFFRFAEKMESHRNAEILWSKFGRSISVELALDPKRRQDADEFLKITRVEYDKLIEQSPSLPPDIIESFKKVFKNNKDIHKPHICNGIDKCQIYKPDKEENVANIVANAGNKLRTRSFKNLNVQNKSDSFLDIKNNLEKKFNHDVEQNNNIKRNNINNDIIKRKSILKPNIEKNIEKNIVNNAINQQNIVNNAIKQKNNKVIIDENNNETNNYEINNCDTNNDNKNNDDTQNNDIEKNNNDNNDNNNYDDNNDNSDNNDNNDNCDNNDNEDIFKDIEENDERDNILKNL